MAPPKIISLFTGIGGLDLGFEAAGFAVAVALDRNAECVEQLRRVTSWPVLEGDLHDIASSNLLREANLHAGDADVLIGGPPCQPFSKSGYWATGETQRLDDPRAGTLHGYLRVLRDTQPRSFLLENVEGLAFRGKSEGLDLLRRTIDGINREVGTQYSVAVRKLNAADFGVPQLRERVFVVGSRDGKGFEFPRPTHAPADRARLLGLEPYRTTWDAIGDLEDAESETPDLAVGGKWADLLPSIPEGENYLWHTDRGGGAPLFGWRRRYWCFLLKLAKNLPSWTIQAQPGPATGPFHWHNRRLSSRELCRLQTFPASCRVEGPIAVVQRLVGNAVPSALAEMLARQIRWQLLGQKVSLASTLIPPVHRPVPPPESPVQVLPKYHHLIGHHDAHPGTGQGYGALARAIGS